MAVIKFPKTGQDQNALGALTAAALLLPGMLPGAAHAVEDAEFTFQYGRYQEGDRQVNSVELVTDQFAPRKVNVPQHFKPIEADSLLTSIKMALTDRIKFSANFSQDTWAGATPVASAPAVFGANDVSNIGVGPDSTFFENGVVTGASPRISDPSAGFYFFDQQLNPVSYDLNTFQHRLTDPEIAHTMALASPETRRQGEFSFTYEWDNAAVNLGGGISVERDYESRFYNIGGRLDFNRKLTSLDFGLSYTNSKTDAQVDHHARAYYTIGDETNAKYGFTSTIVPAGPDEWSLSQYITGRRQDWGFNTAISQVLTKSTVVKLGLNYKYSEGYMSNPYKGVTTFYNFQPSFLDPNYFQAQSAATFIERRPLERNQLTWDARLVQRIEPLDASLHLGYRFSHDDWGIHTHTLEADWIQTLGWGWSVTPRIRYYSQSEADFYTPYMVFREANPVLPAHFSSDHRLSGFGALSGGMVVKKEFTKGVSLEAGFEYYTHQGELKLGGDGEGSYADFDFYMVNAALNVNLSRVGRGLVQDGHTHHHAHGAPLPAGVMFGHMLERDQWMVGYRYQYQHISGDLLHGTQAVPDIEAVNNGCGGSPCYVVPTDMAMHMHMIDLMYAPTDWLTLMLMPQFMDMSMNMKGLEGSPTPTPDLNGSYDGIAISHTQHEHITGGLGDTGVFALFKLFQDNIHHLHLTLGFNAPTGDYDYTVRGGHGYQLGYIHYGMQVGSGTWDFRPNLTYTGHLGDWSWGAQVNANKRIGKNDSGFAFGDILQGMAWGGYKLTDWLNASVRGIYTNRGELQGNYPQRDQQPVIGTMDHPSNYGGEYWDLGLGLTATVNHGDFAGNSVSFEWLQPLIDDVNGYQRERDGALTATWSYMF